MPSAAYQTAYKESGTLKQAPSQDDQLELYALAKIVEGKDVPVAGTFDFKGKAKYNAWKKEKDAGTTPAQAEKRYIKLVENLKTRYGTQ